MNRIKQISIIAWLLAMAMPASVFGQFEARFDYSSSFDDNIYLSPEKTGDLIQDLDLTLRYTLKDSATSFYYNADFLGYIYNPVRNILFNKAGIRYLKDFGKDQDHYVYLGGYVQDRRNTDSYYYYDYQQAYLYSNLRFKLDNTFLKMGYNYRFRRYANIMELTNHQHYAFFQMSRTFRTRTTLFMEADLGFKSFHKTTTYTPVSMGDGKGGNSNIQYTAVEEQIPNMSHLIVLFRVAQALHDRVGINLQYRGQFSMNDESRVNSGSYFEDEELFDDPFSYTSSGLSSKLTVILPKQMYIQAGGDLTLKDYISEKSYISAEDSTGMGDLRADTRINAFLKLSKTFYLKARWIDSINPYLNYSYVDNRSNSYWYNYNYHYLVLGIVFNF